LPGVHFPVIIDREIPKEAGLMAALAENEFQSRIGKGTKFSGKINFKAPAKIEGEAEGEITGDEIVIGQGAVVTARISASRITVAGSVSGEIIARERIELLATANIRCNITTPSLVLNEGAKFEGDCKMPREKPAVVAAPTVIAHPARENAPPAATRDPAA
jgi:cytoskeletal protein CcmA (bactofilin family)